MCKPVVLAGSRGAWRQARRSSRPSCPRQEQRLRRGWCRTSCLSWRSSPCLCDGEENGGAPLQKNFSSGESSYFCNSVGRMYGQANDVYCPPGVTVVLKLSGVDTSTNDLLPNPNGHGPRSINRVAGSYTGRRNQASLIVTSTFDSQIPPLWCTIGSTENITVPDLIEKVRKEWPLIRAAPWSIVTVIAPIVVLFIGATWFAAQQMNSAAIIGTDATIESLKTQIESN